MNINIISKDPYIINFKSIQYNHYFIIEINLLLNYALISEINIKYTNSVELVYLLIHIKKKLKEYNIKYIIQQIKQYDLEYIKKNKYYQIINKNDIYNYYNIRCDIDFFPQAFMKNIGFEN